MPDTEAPLSSILLYQTEDGRTRIECRFDNETIWGSQALLADLFRKDVRTINEHQVNVFEEGEMSRVLADALPRPVDADIEQAVKQLARPPNP